jgi:hypothetical protein
MWRGVVKGACVPLVGDTSRKGTKRHIGSRNIWENAKRQVWNTILKREAAAMGRIHVYDASTAPCDDPEDQMVVTMLRTGHYALKPSWVYEKGDLDLSRFHSLWRSTVQPDLLEVKDIVNIMFPRAFFRGDENAESDEDTNFTYASCSSALRNDSHSQIL